MKMNLGKNFEQLPGILAQYEEEYEDCKAELDLGGKTLQQILTTNSRYQSYYSERGAELKHLHEHMAMRLEEVKGKLYQGYKKGSNIALGPQEIAQYIKSDSEYISVNIKMLEVKELYDKYAYAIEGFKHIGYHMTNLTKLRVAGLEDEML